MPHPNQVTPYIPPWRRQALLAQFTHSDQSQSGAPAAQEEGEKVGSILSLHAPGPGKANRILNVMPKQAFLGLQKKQSSDPTQEVLKYTSDPWSPCPPAKQYPHTSTLDTCPPPAGLGRFLKYKKQNSAWASKTGQVLNGKLTAIPPLAHAGLSSQCFQAAGSLQIQTSLQTKNSISSLTLKRMADITPEDEAFIQRFVGLSTFDSSSQPIIVPARAATSTDWSRALLLRIVTDRTVLDNPFSEAMLKAWNASPDTVFRSVSRNCFLVEFFSQQDMDTALLAGPWTFRGDLVAARQVSSHADLNIEHIGYGQLWVQLFNVPFNSLTEEGIQILTQKLGTPISPSVEGLVNGRRFIKQKISFKLDEALKDTLPTDHPTLGLFKVYCHYEKVARICTFCGRLGHEIGACNDRIRLTMLLQRPDQAGKYDAAQLLKPKYGSWMTNSGCIPKQGTDSNSSGSNRANESSSQRQENSTPSFFVGQMVSKLPPPSSDSYNSTSSEGSRKRLRPAGQDSPAQLL